MKIKINARKKNYAQNGIKEKQGKKFRINFKKQKSKENVIFPLLYTFFTANEN